MKGRLLILLTTLALATGCAAARPVAMTPVSSEPDPWAGFTNGVKDPEAKAEPKADPKPETKSETKSEPKADSFEKIAKAESADSAEPEDTKPVPAKKAGKKKAKRAGAVAGKKPRKRAKKQG